MLDRPQEDKVRGLGVTVTGPLKAFDAFAQICRDPLLLIATDASTATTRARILSVNEPGESMLQFPAHRLHNQSFHQLLVAPEAELNNNWAAHNFDGEDAWEGPLALRTRNSQIVKGPVAITKLGNEGHENYFMLRFIQEKPTDIQIPEEARTPPELTFWPPPSPSLPTSDEMPTLAAPAEENPFQFLTPPTTFSLSPDFSFSAPADPLPEPLPELEIAPEFEPPAVESFLPEPQAEPAPPAPIPPAPSADHAPSNMDMARLEAVLRHTPAGIFRVQVLPNKEFRYIGANQRHEEMAGQSSELIAGKTPEDIMPIEQAQQIRRRYEQCLDADKPITYEEFLELPAGGRWWQTTLVPLKDDSGEIVEMVGVSYDVSDRKNTAEALADKINQQAAIAELGQLALTQLDLRVMLNKAAEIVAQALNVPFCKIQEYSSTEQTLILRAGIGWNEELHTPYSSSIWENTQAAATLKSLNPIIVENYDGDSRFVPSPLLQKYEIKSGVAVVITGLSGPYGILSIYSNEVRAFNEDQVYFLQAAADTIASAIKNNMSERALRESERLVSSILESAQIGIGVSDESGRFVRVNPAFCRIFGYESKDLLGREFTVLLPLPEHQKAREVYQQFMKTGMEMPGEGTCLRSDGRPVDVQITAGRLERADGSMLRVTTVEDITRRKAIENSLRLFQLAALNSNDGIIITEPGPIDSPGPRIIFCNAAAAQITGFSQNEIIGSNLMLFQGGETERTKILEIQSGMRMRQPREVELVLHHKDKSPYWAQIGLVPVNDLNGRHMNWLMTLRNITERKQGEHQLQSAKEQADTANQAKSDFLAGISHEIRTPLNAIIGFADVLRRELFGPMGHDRYKTYATDIHDSGRHLLQLINNTLDLSKIEAGVLELHESEIPMDAVIRSSMALMRDNAQNAKIKLQTEIQEDLPRLRGDETKIKQILLNMLSNAIKYTLPNGTITIICKTDERGLVLQVRDTGVGIPKSELGKVMQKYTQASNEQNKHMQGTGLGIPVTKSLIELHQGILELDSEEGVGTTISAIFPKERFVSVQANPFPGRKIAS